MAIFNSCVSHYQRVNQLSPIKSHEVTIKITIYGYFIIAYHLVLLGSPNAIEATEVLSGCRSRGSPRRVHPGLDASGVLHALDAWSAAWAVSGWGTTVMVCLGFYVWNYYMGLCINIYIYTYM